MRPHTTVPPRAPRPAMLPRCPTWQNLDPEQQKAILHALGRLLARRLLHALVDDKEVADDID